MVVERVAVVGAGTMGSGIAQVAATHGCTVRLIDAAPGAVERAIDGIRRRFDSSVERGRMSAEERDATLARIVPSDIDDIGDVQLVVEVVVEDLGVKRQVFPQLEAAAPADAVLATNTSSLSISEIARSLADPGRLVGMHFFNPAPVMPLVEVVAGEQSRAEAVDLVAATASAWEKIPVRAKDTPGFIVNRVARTSYVEAFGMVHEGVGDPAVIDGAMRKLGNYRMGPMQVADLVGLEVNLAVTESVWWQSGRPVRFAPPLVQQELVNRGELGQKTGRGVYDYSGDEPAANYRAEMRPLDLSDDLTAAVDAFVEAAALCEDDTREACSPVERYAFARILVTVMNEAARARDEGVATAEDIDVALQRATNYPRGPVEWGDAVGAERVRNLLAALSVTVADDRYAPASAFA